METAYFTHKRREYRIPLAMPATFFKDDMIKPFKGHIENISSFGALARVAIPVPKNTSLNLVFDIPETGKRVESGGRVRWCQGNRICRLGVEFEDKISFDLPLKQVAKLCSHDTKRAVNDYSDKQTDLLQRSIKELQHRTYWGTLFGAFSNPMHTLFAQLAGQIGLSVFRFEKFHGEKETSSADQKEQSRVRESICALESVSSKLNEIASVFGLLRREDPKGLKRDTNVNIVIQDKIKFLQDITMKLANKKCNINYLPNENPPLFRGRYSDFAQSIESLLLYSYHSILFGHCNGITVRSMFQNQTIQIDFCDDGSKILEERNIVIDYVAANSVARLSTRDMRNVLRFYHALIPLKESNAYLVVQSESGNNIISLRIPV
jgi:hypothetical protein